MIVKGVGRNRTPACNAADSKNPRRQPRTQVADPIEISSDSSDGEEMNSGETGNDRHGNADEDADENADKDGDEVDLPSVNALMCSPALVRDPVWNVNAVCVSASAEPATAVAVVGTMELGQDSHDGEDDNDGEGGNTVVRDKAPGAPSDALSPNLSQPMTLERGQDQSRKRRPSRSSSVDCDEVGAMRQSHKKQKLTSSPSIAAQVSPNSSQQQVCAVSSGDAPTGLDNSRRELENDAAADVDHGDPRAALHNGACTPEPETDDQSQQCNERHNMDGDDEGNGGALCADHGRQGHIGDKEPGRVHNVCQDTAREQFAPSNEQRGNYNSTDYIATPAGTDMQEAHVESRPVLRLPAPEIGDVLPFKDTPRARTSSQSRNYEAASSIESDASGSSSSEESDVPRAARGAGQVVRPPRQHLQHQSPAKPSYHSRADRRCQGPRVKPVVCQISSTAVNTPQTGQRPVPDLRRKSPAPPAMAVDVTIHSATLHISVLIVIGHGDHVPNRYCGEVESAVEGVLGYVLAVEKTFVKPLDRGIWMLTGLIRQPDNANMDKGVVASKQAPRPTVKSASLGQPGLQLDWGNTHGKYDSDSSNSMWDYALSMQRTQSAGIEDTSDSDSHGSGTYDGDSRISKRRGGRGWTRGEEQRLEDDVKAGIAWDLIAASLHRTSSATKQHWRIMSSKRG